MQLTNILAATTLASLAASSPIASRETTQQNSFSITNFVFGCTVTCDWSFDVVNTNEHLPSHPAVTTPVHCKGSLDNNNSFQPGSCGPISDTQQFSAYINKLDNELRLQYKVNAPSTGATYFFEGQKVVGAATGSNPSPPAFEVLETKAYAVA